jgi:hypothetical protein
MFAGDNGSGGFDFSRRVQNLTRQRGHDVMMPLVILTCHRVVQRNCGLKAPKSHPMRLRKVWPGSFLFTARLALC